MLGKLLKHEFRATRRSVGMVILGSLLASAAYETVRECLELYDKPWNRDDSLATPPAVDLSRLRNKECGH